jgi:uncharacterized membrane protein
MKNIGLCFILVGMFVSCDLPKDGEDIPTSKLEVLTSLGDEDTVKNVEETKVETTDVARVSKNQKPLVIARGSEPGWYAEFFADHLRLLVDYGADSLILEKDFSGINNDKTYSAAIVENSTENKDHKSISLSISLTDKPCTEEASGEKREKSISIKYKGKTYKGCATPK